MRISDWSSDVCSSDLFYPAEFGKRLDRYLRRPLGRIIANADSIGAQLEGPLRPDYLGYAGDISAAGRHLMALIDDLADLQEIDRPDFSVTARSEERRVGKECGSTCRYRWSP